MVLAYFINDFTEALFVDLRGLGNRLIFILHYKVFHIDSSWLIDGRLYVGRTQVRRH